MFNAPPPSPEEVRQQEAVVQQTVYGAFTMCAVLYFSPFVVDYVRNLI